MQEMIEDCHEWLKQKPPLKFPETLSIARDYAWYKKSLTHEDIQKLAFLAEQDSRFDKYLLINDETFSEEPIENDQ